MKDDLGRAAGSAVDFRLVRRRSNATLQSRKIQLPELAITPAYVTRCGQAYQGDAREILRQLAADSVSLVLTSPPFALRRQKAYGNVAASEYVDWFWPFAEEIYRILKPDGSFVLELGGAWNPGSGTRSLYQYELILRLSRFF